MPKDEAEPEDPMELVGVELPVASDADLLSMADCFIEEFARLGWPREKVLKMFSIPFYAAPYRIFLAKGEPFVRGRIDAASAYFETQPRQEKPHAQSA